MFDKLQGISEREQVQKFVGNVEPVKGLVFQGEAAF